MKNLGITHSVCGTCLKIIPAKIVTDETDVFFHKFCPTHGPSQNLIRTDVNDYLQSQRYVKPAWVPKSFHVEKQAPCPDNCGFCNQHEQHLCMPFIEITNRCDLACPVCLVDAGKDQDMTVDQLNNILDKLIAAEGRVDILNFSGGEPLVHSNLLALIDATLARPQIIRLSISTNGLRLLQQPDLIDELKKRNVVVSLQFDGFDDKAYQILRGRKLLEQKLAILDLLADSQVTTSLTVTVAGDINDHQLPRILEYFFSHPNVVSMMIQPIAFTGRGASLKNTATRLTIPDIMNLLGDSGNPYVTAKDFAPLPCSHPLCFNLAYYLMLDDKGGAVSLNQLLGASRLMDTLANRTIFGLDEDEHETLKDIIYELWSAPAAAAPDTEKILKTLRTALNELTQTSFDPRKTFTVAEKRIKSIFIHAFQDVDTFDLARVRRCCNAYPQPDGSLMPACVYNVIKRNKQNRENQQ